MRTGLLTAIALALAGVGEAQWAIAFLGVDHGLFPALMVLVAGIGLAIAAFGFYTDAEGQNAASPVGLAVAAAAHVGYIVAYAAQGHLTNVGPVTLATLGSALGLAIAAYGARRGAATLSVARAGLAIACVTGILWLVGDAQEGVFAFMFGNVLVPLGWGLAALFAGRPESVA
ncbi:MAG: hypothetical protein QOE90_3200 [Thermoplasmata archaeon]|jgi:hypothetical protein|nr:hypothetical protein [Thermoplasmata archaeon]